MDRVLVDLGARRTCSRSPTARRSTEGKLTLGGPLQPFKAGAGLIAVEGATPVVPVTLRIHRMSVIDRRRLPASFRGDVEFVIGEPIWFDADTDHAAATTRVEAPVAALQAAGPGQGPTPAGSPAAG